MRKYLLLALVVLTGSIAYAVNETRVIFDSDLPVNTTKVFDVGKYDRFTVQAVYEESSPSSDTVSDGILGSITITIPATTTNLIGTAASGTINFEDYTAVSGDTVVINGRPFIEGTDYDAETSSSVSAANLATAISNYHPDVSATSSGSTVTVTARSFGTAGNFYNLTTTDASNLVVSGSSLSGGIDAPSVTIDGITLTEDTDFDIVTSSDTSATNLANAIGGDSTLSAIFSTSTTSNVITLTKIYPSNTPSYVSASTTGITVGAWTYGTEGDIDIDNDYINQANHGFSTGLALLFSNVSGTDPGGLTDQTTYYAIKFNENYYQLATSTQNAVDGTDIDITGVTGGGSFTFAPLAFAAGSSGFSWQGSNDNSSWTTLTGTPVDGVSIASVTYSADGNYLWDFGTYDYRYLRMNYTGPTTGALSIDFILNGKVD